MQRHQSGRNLMEESSRDDEISQKAFLHLSTHIFISIGTQRAFFPIHRHLRYFQTFRCCSFPFFFIIHVISVCHFPTVTLEPTVYSRQKEPTGRMLCLSKLWLCIVNHCCLWFLFCFCLFLFLIYPHTGVTVSYDIKCCFAL